MTKSARTKGIASLRLTPGHRDPSVAAVKRSRYPMRRKLSIVAFCSASARYGPWFR